MKKFSYSVLIFCIFCTFSCKENVNDPPLVSNPPAEFYKVSGKLIRSGQPLAEALVSINDIDSLKSISDSTGFFEILNVPENSLIQSLKVSKDNHDGSFSARSIPIVIQNDIYLDSIVIPKSIKMYPPDSSINSITISWNKAEANNIVQYWLYRSIASEFDQSSGQLIHNSSNLNDTIYTDLNLPSGIRYYYRVYLMDVYGTLGWSDIVGGGVYKYDVFPITLGKYIRYDYDGSDTNPNYDSYYYYGIVSYNFDYVIDSNSTQIVWRVERYDSIYKKINNGPWEPNFISASFALFENLMGEHEINCPGDSRVFYSPTQLGLKYYRFAQFSDVRVDSLWEGTMSSKADSIHLRNDVGIIYKYMGNSLYSIAGRTVVNTYRLLGNY